MIFDGLELGLDDLFGARERLVLGEKLGQLLSLALVRVALAA